VTDFVKSLRQASFRGVPFGVLAAEARFGRRLAVHEYPKRDKPFAEDMGRRTRPIAFTAFLVGNSRVYGGGDVLEQREKLIAAAETAGPGLLVHPTLGDLTVSLDDIVVVERWDGHHYFEVAFRFIESGERLFPKPAADTAQTVAAKGLEARLQAAEAWAAKATGALSRGAVAVQTALSTARQWIDRVTTLGQDATGMLRLSASLVGSFGRYFNGRLAGGFTALIGLRSPLSSLADLVDAGAARRALLALGGEAVLTALGRLGQGGTPAEVAAAVADQIDTLAETAIDPADRVRLLLDLADFTITQDLAATRMGAALGDLYRRTAVVALSTAAAAYQPASFDDARDLLARLVDALDREILIAGDAGEDGVYVALRAQRAAVALDLRARGADLAPIGLFTTPAPVPALAAAQRIYRDAGRADELVIQADPIHPLFMPVQFRALAR
jgi:prophage DNA circulation protein